MSDLILHEYPESMFAEKIRAIMRYKGINYRRVTIPIIMPKPMLLALTGGYRRTPVLQIGADIYCDSALIARLLDDIHPEPPIFPRHIAATATALAHWTDTFFFQATVRVAFQPRGRAGITWLSDPEQAKAFAQDRAELSRNSNQLGLSFETAHPHFLQHLGHLEKQLGSLPATPFLLGNEPTIADFSTYHCLWLVHNNELIRDTLDPFHEVCAWYDRMKDIGNDIEVADISGEEAIEIAKTSEPAAPGPIESSLLHGIDPSSDVNIMPIDYGRQPTRGRLVTASTEELALIRTDHDAGEVIVHFPRLGYQINQAK